MRGKRSGSGRAEEWRKRLRQMHAAQMAAVSAVTIAVVIVCVNLFGAERRIERPIPHTYVTADSQFVRSMSSLVGPGFVAGNRVTPLTDGDEVFPAMLAAIRSA